MYGSVSHPISFKNLAYPQCSIYLVRLAVTTTYNIRISKIQARSDTLQKQRDATIEKLKAATRYNTTQELLKKYGGTPPSKERSDEKSSPKNLSTQKSSPASGQGRTGFVPPPTANIPGRNVPVSLPGTPQQVTPGLRNQNGPSSAAAAVAPWQASPPRMSPSAEFAPNAFSSAPQYAQQSHGPRWYDRLMDLVLGEDETLPRNRLALICHHCRLVNGQAPPGVQRLEDMGSWRCMGCGTMNGEEKEETKLLKQMQEHTESPKMGPRIVAEKSHTADAGSAAGSTDEDDYSLEDTENLSNTESSEGESKKHETRGAATGAQKGGNSTRRRSKRVQNKAKG